MEVQNCAELLTIIINKHERDYKILMNKLLSFRWPKRDRCLYIADQARVAFVWSGVL